MSFKDTIKGGEGSIIDSITEDIDRVAISEDKVDTDKKCTSCEQNKITEGTDSVALMSMCASCGKEGNSDDMNTCNKCEEVKYCNAACKKKHRKKHKKACEKRVAELYDEKLFADPPPPEECPICLLPPNPNDERQSCFHPCCGKVVCNGCMFHMAESEGVEGCPFCRMSADISDEEVIKQTKMLVDKGNRDAMFYIGTYYDQGRYGVPQDHQRAKKLYLKAGELGHAVAYFNLGIAYNNGTGVEVDKKKAQHYYELAAMKGDVHARYNLGCIEGPAGNHHRAFKHYMIAARAGHEKALEMIKRGFMAGLITKDGYASTMRAYQMSQDEVKSDARDKIARFIQENPVLTRRYLN